MSARTAELEAKLSAHQARHDDPRRSLSASPFMQWKFFTPLLWAPAFPIIRFSTAGMEPRKRHICLGVAILIANLHGFWLINNPDLSDEALAGSEVGPLRRSNR